MAKKGFLQGKNFGIAMVWMIGTYVLWLIVNMILGKLSITWVNIAMPFIGIAAVLVAGALGGRHTEKFGTTFFAAVLSSIVFVVINSIMLINAFATSELGTLIGTIAGAAAAVIVAGFVWLYYTVLLVIGAAIGRRL